MFSKEQKINESFYKPYSFQGCVISQEHIEDYWVQSYCVFPLMQQHEPTFVLMDVYCIIIIACMIYGRLIVQYFNSSHITDITYEHDAYNEHASFSIKNGFWIENNFSWVFIEKWVFRNFIYHFIVPHPVYFKSLRIIDILYKYNI